MAVALSDVSKLKIICYPDPRLHKNCKPVTQFDESLERLAHRMIELMQAAKGVGLAAPQVGVLLRMFVCNISTKKEDTRVFINPRLTDLSGHQVGDEGCLSIPEVIVSIPRSSSCTVHAFDLKGKPFELSGKDLTARCWQHEYDHLNGRLITDRMSDEDRIANRRLLRDLEKGYGNK